MRGWGIHFVVVEFFKVCTAPKENANRGPDYYSLVDVLVAGLAILTFHCSRSLMSTNISALLFPSQAVMPSCIMNIGRPAAFPLDFHVLN